MLRKFLINTSLMLIVLLSGCATQSPSMPVPIVVPDGGYRIKYNLAASMANANITANGHALLQFERQGGQYTAVLSAMAKQLGLSFKLMGRASGIVRSNTIMTSSFIETVDVPFSDAQQNKFDVDYTNRTVSFTVKGQSNQSNLTSDAVYDYVSAICYLQMALQQGQLRSGSGAIKLPMALGNSVEMARINLGDFEPASTFVNTNNNSAIPATITLNSKNLKYIKVWFVAEKNYMPLKIEIATKKIQLTLLAREIG